jgi:hypothetical protein
MPAGTTYHWIVPTGNTSNWANGNNWSLTQGGAPAGVYPGAAPNQSATFDGGVGGTSNGFCNCDLPISDSVATLTLAKAYSGQIMLMEPSFQAANISVGGGAILTSGNNLGTSLTPISGLTLTGGLILCQGPETIFTQALTLNGSGVISLNRATLNLNGTVYSAPSAQSGTFNKAITPITVSLPPPVGSLAYSLVGLPSGLSINSGGVISGTPTQTGTFNGGYSRGVSGGGVITQAITYNIAPGAPKVCSFVDGGFSFARSWLQIIKILLGLNKTRSRQRPGVPAGGLILPV